MYREEGLGAFYKGLLPCLLLSLNATIQDTIFEGIKDAWLKRQNLSAAAKAGVDLAQMKLREVQVLELCEKIYVFFWFQHIFAYLLIFFRGVGTTKKISLMSCFWSCFCSSPTWDGFSGGLMVVCLAGCR